MRHVDAGGGRNRLGDQGRDRSGAFMDDLPLHVLGAFQGAPAVAGAEVATIFGRLGDMDVARHERAELGRHAAAARPAAAEAGAGERRAVVGAAPAHHLPAVRLAVQVVVVLRDLERGLVRLRAAAHIVDPGLRVAGIFGKLGGERRRHRRDRVVRREGERQHLLIDGVGDLTSAVADVDQPETREGVEPAFALGVLHPHALAARHQLHAGFFRHVADGFRVRPEMRLGVSPCLIDICGVRQLAHRVPFPTAIVSRARRPNGQASPAPPGG